MSKQKKKEPEVIGRVSGLAGSRLIAESCEHHADPKMHDKVLLRLSPAVTAIYLTPAMCRKLAKLLQGEGK